MESIPIKILNSLVGNTASLRLILQSPPKNYVLPDPSSKCCTYDYYFGIL